MVWVLIVLSGVVLWVVASLCKILHRSLSASNAALLIDGFTAPAIPYLISRGIIRSEMFIYCNADGIGNIRKEELYLVSSMLKIPPDQVKILEHPDLQVFSFFFYEIIVEKENCAHGIDLIITFDDYGLSGSCNHCDVHRGVRRLEEWELVSTNILFKCCGPFDIWLSIIFGCQSHGLLNLDPSKSYAAMAQHFSQWVWQRKLVVSVSSYTYVNTLKKIK
ncbi:hypothetical protein Pfo_012704 [Paulownia fortunei]|nr:hypothetical protein Pfo_012704 [Paulownia fortunei]